MQSYVIIRTADMGPPACHRGMLSGFIAQLLYRAKAVSTQSASRLRYIGARWTSVTAKETMKYGPLRLNLMEISACARIESVGIYQ